MFLGCQFGSRPSLLEDVLAVVQEAGVQAVRDAVDLALVGDALLDRVGVHLPVRPFREIVVQGRQVAGVHHLADRVAAEVRDVRAGATLQGEQQLGVVVAIGNLLEVDGDLGAGVGLGDLVGGRLDVRRLLARFVRVADGDGAGQVRPRLRRRGLSGRCSGGRRGGRLAAALAQWSGPPPAGAVVGLAAAGGCVGWAAGAGAVVGGEPAPDGPQAATRVVPMPNTTAWRKKRRRVARLSSDVSDMKMRLSFSSERTPVRRFVAPRQQDVNLGFTSACANDSL